MGTKAKELALLAAGKGCLGKAADDEPVFILRAQDMLAPDTVQYWASRLRTLHLEGAPISSKVTEALACARLMREWQDAHGRKVPD